MKHYIGITGFKRTEEVRQIAQIGEDIGYPNTHSIMFGYLTSEKRLITPEQGGKRSPAANELRDLVAATPDWGISMLHYFSQDKMRAESDIIRLVDMTGADAVQINMDWPLVASIEKIKNAHPTLDILLQLPARAMEGMMPSDIVDRVGRYQELITYTLIDPSGGKGTAFDLDKGSSLLYQLQKEHPKISHGIAGGFTPHNVAERTEELYFRLTQPFNIDAESGVMTEDTLDMDKCKEYLEHFQYVAR